MDTADENSLLGPITYTCGGFASRPRLVRASLHFWKCWRRAPITRLAARHPKFPLHIFAGRKDLHLAICVDYEPCVLDVSLGVVCTCHGLQRKKVRRRNLNFLKWAAQIYVLQSHWRTAASRNWKLNLGLCQQRRLLKSPKPMKWDGLFTSCDLSDLHMDSEIGWKLTERHSNKNRLRCGHRERSFNPVSICNLSNPSSAPERGHWGCTEDYSTMWGSLNSVFEHCKRLMKLFIRKHRKLNKKSKTCKLGSAISWSLSWTT